ncbi:MAG: GNAT family N-acetyltransferase [Methyloceanibacter sp.]
MRCADASDLEVVRTITADAYATFQADIGMVPLPVAEDYAPRIARGEVWLKDEAGLPVALVVLESYPDHLVIFSVAVRAEWQGRGLGGDLLRFADSKAREAKVPEIRLYTNGRMVRQMALYRRHGFARIGQRPHPTLPGHTLVDMTKPTPIDD